MSFPHQQVPILLSMNNLAVGQNQWYHFGVGAPCILVHLSGDWDVHWGYGILTHGHLLTHTQNRCAPSSSAHSAHFRAHTSLLDPFAVSLHIPIPTSTSTLSLSKQMAKQARGNWSKEGRENFLLGWLVIPHLQHLAAAQ